MKFLITNDDGIDAPGLAALARAAADWGRALVVAPHEHLSGCSHRATTDRGIKLVSAADDRHALEGTPVDCARIGLAHLAPETDWVLSGINEGGNLGADVYHSGTVAAVREAALLGKPGIAVSQYRRRRKEVDWNLAAQWTRQVLEVLLAQPPERGVFWNVNLPDPLEPIDAPRIVFCKLDPHPLPVQFQLEEGHLHYRGVYQQRAREPGQDVDVCFSGAIAVTRLSLAWPDHAPPSHG
jgi:5'-nucleotidase